MQKKIWELLTKLLEQVHQKFSAIANAKLVASTDSLLKDFVVRSNIYISDYFFCFIAEIYFNNW